MRAVLFRTVLRIVFISFITIFFLSCSAVKKAGNVVKTAGQIGLAMAESKAAGTSGKRSSRKLAIQPTHLAQFSVRTQYALGKTGRYNIWLADDLKSFKNKRNPALKTILILPYEKFSGSAGTAEMLSNSESYKKGKTLGADYALRSRVNEINLETSAKAYRAHTTIHVELIDVQTGKTLKSSYINDSQGVFDPARPQGAAVGFTPWKTSSNDAFSDAVKRCEKHIVAFVEQS